MPRAIYWLTQAAKARQKQALATLGKVMVYGTYPEEVRQDVQGGMGLLMTAAKEGHNESALYFGTALLEGVPELGIPQDEFVGIVFVELAARRGDLRALEMMVRYSVEKDEPLDKLLLWVGALAKLSDNPLAALLCSDLANRYQTPPEVPDAVAALVKRVGHLRRADEGSDTGPTIPSIDRPHEPIYLAEPLRVVGLPLIETRFAKFS